MKHKWLIKWILIVVIAIFELHFLSQLVFHLATDDSPDAGSRFFKVSHLFFPLDADPTFMYGYSLLKRGLDTGNQELINRSIVYFKRAIDKNMLHYNSHFYLGKAYLHSSKQEARFFEEALLAFKRAAYIRGKKEAIGVDTLTLLLSLWPHLNEADKTFCQELFVALVPKLQRQRFAPLLQVWGLYVKDYELMNKTLQQKPIFYLDVARAIPGYDIGLTWRHKYMAQYERHLLEGALKRLQALKKGDPDYLKGLKRLYRRMRSRIRGFYRLVENSGFNETSYYETRARIEIKLLRHLLDHTDWKKDRTMRNEIETMVLSSLEELPMRSHMEDMRDLLSSKRFFNIEDLYVFYVRQMIDFRLTQYDIVVNAIEQLRQSISFVKKEHQEMYVKILLLLARSYHDNRLLSNSLIILKEIQAIATERLDIYWQMLKVESVYGAEKGADPLKKKYDEILRSSRLIQLSSRSWQGMVYLFDLANLQIVVAEALQTKLANYNILQVFVNERIYREILLRELQDKSRITIPLPDKNRKYHISIKVI